MVEETSEGAWDDAGFREVWSCDGTMYLSWRGNRNGAIIARVTPTGDKRDGQIFPRSFTSDRNSFDSR